MKALRRPACGMRIRIQQHVKADVWAGLQAILTGLDSAVGVVTYRRLDGQGFKPQWGQDIPSLSKLAPKQSGQGVVLTTHTTTITEGEELYLNSPSEPSWSVAGQTLPLQAILLTVNEVYVRLIKLFVHMHHTTVVFTGCGWKSHY